MVTDLNGSGTQASRAYAQLLGFLWLLSCLGGMTAQQLCPTGICGGPPGLTETKDCQVTLGEGQLLSQQFLWEGPWWLSRSPQKRLNFSESGASV